MNKDVHIWKFDCYICKKSCSVGSNNLQCTAECLSCLVFPITAYPSFRFFAVIKILRNICTFPLMDWYSVTSRNITYNLIARQRITTIWELNQNIVCALNYNTRRCFWLFTGSLRNFDFFYICGIGFLVFFLNSRHNFPKLNTAVTDCGINIVESYILLFHKHFFNKLNKLFIGKINAVALKFFFKHLLTFGNVFITLFVLIPLTNFWLCRSSLTNIYPCFIRLLFFLSNNLADFTRF